MFYDNLKAFDYILINKSLQVKATLASIKQKVGMLHLDEAVFINTNSHALTIIIKALRIKKQKSCLTTFHKVRPYFIFMKCTLFF